VFCIRPARLSERRAFVLLAASRTSPDRKGVNLLWRRKAAHDGRGDSAEAMYLRASGLMWRVIHAGVQ
jgi:hypothetical protein